MNRSVPALALLGGCAACELNYELSGSVEGQDIASDTYRADASWPDPETDLIPQIKIDEPAMIALGLDPEDAEDVARFSWLVQGPDVTLQLLELDDDERMTRRFLVYLYGMDEYDVQPGQQLEVLNFDALAEAMAVSSPEQLRQALDEVRQLDQPRVAVSFAAYEDSGPIDHMTYNYLDDPENRWATDGSVTFEGARDRDGELLDALVHPEGGISRISLSGDPTFGADATRFRADCVHTTDTNPWTLQ